MSKHPPLLLTLLIIFATLTASAIDSHAQDNEGAAAWGLLTAEASTLGVGAMLINDQELFEGGGYLLSFAPLLLGGGVGYLARDSDPRAAYALHGGVFLGANLFWIGSQLDAIGRNDDMYVGRSALVLGALGIAGGTWFGATQVRDGDFGVPFLLAPTAGLVVGGVGSAVVSLFIDQKNFVKAAIIGGAAGMAAGFTVAIVGTMLTQNDSPSDSSMSRMPPSKAAGSPVQTKLFSFGGSF